MPSTRRPLPRAICLCLRHGESSLSISYNRVPFEFMTDVTARAGKSLWWPAWTLDSVRLSDETILSVLFLWYFLTYVLQTQLAP